MQRLTRDPVDPTDANSAAWACSSAELLQRLGVRPESGLAAHEIAPRRATYGDNAPRAARSRSAWSILIAQLRSFVMLLLLVAALVSFFIGDAAEAVAIAVVVVVNVAIGFFTERSATRSMEALRTLTETTAKVRRDGHVTTLAASELVVGDVVLLEAGDLIPADLRWLSLSRLQVNESALTGESVPVDKSIEAVRGDALLAERTSLGFRGTAVTRGVATGVVFATGRRSELGRVADLLGEEDEGKTPLETQLDRLGHKLAWVALAAVSMIALAGLLRGEPPWPTITTAIALAIATVPEGLPVVATIALARGMFRMAGRNALISKLAAVETLGSVDVIFTDKTGTLTENRMTVETLVFADGARQLEAAGDHPSAHRALRIGALCSAAHLEERDGEAVGDPMETALLVAGFRLGLEPARLAVEFPCVHQDPFDPALTLMASTHRAPGGGLVIAVKGAPEAVLEHSTHEVQGKDTRPLTPETRSRWQRANQDLAKSGMRVLALAERMAARIDASPYHGLVLVGLVGLVDPPRADVASAMRRVRQAGIRVIVLTGDQAATARFVARKVESLAVDDLTLSAPDLHLETEEGRTRALSTALFSRVSPEQKLAIVELHQDAGHIVAMLGDGINDAPALRRADIGVAMGQRGTAVAQEASDMVLRDDQFSTIVAAVEQGRVIYDNIRKFVVYLLSCNTSELIAVGVSSLLAVPVALTALQILFLNLVTDVFPALALAANEAAPGVMLRPPRDPKRSIIERRHWFRIATYGMAMTVAVLATLAISTWSWAMPPREAVTLSFLTLAFAQLLHVFNMAAEDAPVLDNEITRNPWVWGALGLCTALLLVALYWGPVARALDLEPPEPRGWTLVGMASLLPLVSGMAWRALRRQRHIDADRAGWEPRR